MINKCVLIVSTMFDRLLNFLFYISCVMVVFQMFSVSADVVMRYLFARPIRGVVSLNEWSLLFLTFLGIAWLQKEKGHVTVDLITSKFKGRIRLLSEIFASGIGVLVSLALVVFGVLVTWRHFLSGFYDVHKIVFPLSFIIFIIPLGAFLLMVQLIRDIYKNSREMHRFVRDSCSERANNQNLKNM